MYKINDNKFPKNVLTFLRELLVLYGDSRVMNGVGKKEWEPCATNPGLPILMVRSRPGCELRWIDIRPVFLRTKTPEVVVFVENALPHAAIACIWC